ncbi:NUDIX hydrolase [Candidatus Pacearchaeota archaeon]|nr:NUDIX hydrolase [Candidatus Pacearchaeota archaeon]
MKQEFRNPSATADIIVEQEGKILLVKRKSYPFEGMWALPGGYLEYGKETLEETACRELREETGLIVKRLELIGIYSAPDRDPRGHVISSVYAAEVSGTAAAGDDAKELRYFSLNELPKLAFDHEKIIKDYLTWRKNGK